MERPVSNPGFEGAEAAGDAIGAPVFIPQFAPRHHPAPGDRKGPTDVDDLWRLEGPAEVRRQLAEQLAAQAQAQAQAPAPDPEPEPTPAPVGPRDDSEIVAELATLPPMERDRRIKSYAKELGVGVGSIRAAVAQYERAARSGPTLQGVEIEFPEIEPWPRPIPLADTLDDLVAVLRRHVLMQPDHYVIAPLWAAHCHCFRAFSHTPRLLVDAPAEECGKTVLLKVIMRAVPRPMYTQNFSEATFFRLNQSHGPCWFLDEADVWALLVKAALHDVNAGWEPLALALRCVGDDQEVRGFSTFGPIAIAGIDLSKHLPRTLITRAHQLTLQRASDDEAANIQRFDDAAHGEALSHVARQLARWVADNGDRLASHTPKFPDGVFNRRADKWRAMLTLAELASPEWADRARDAILADEGAPQQSMGVELLTDICAIIQPGETRLLTETLIDRLVALPNSRWGDHNFKARSEEKRRLRPDQLAEILRPFAIKPHDKKIAGIVRKGYDVDEIADAMERYGNKDHPEKGTI